MNPGVLGVSDTSPLEVGGDVSIRASSLSDGGGARITGETCSVEYDELAESVMDRKEAQLKSSSSWDTCWTGANLTCGP